MIIKTHKLEDGDIIKILPMIDSNDKISWIKKYDCICLNTETFINDNSDKAYLKRISGRLRESNSSIKLPITNRYAMNIYINSEIRILNIGKTLFEIIKNNPKLLDIRENHHLFVVKKVIIGGGYHAKVFPSFDNSYVSEKNWEPPVVDVNSKDEWYSYIKSNQPDFDNHIEKNNIFNKKQLLINILGTDMLSELISDDRERKLDMIL